MESSSPLDILVRLVGDFPPGSVSLVGAGPGTALISVRGAVRLAQADVILHDKLIGPELLDLTRPDAEHIFVGKWRGEHVWTQDEINAALVTHARAGKRVARLKGGDPFVFGRGGEECEYLAAAGIRFEVVPGITAAFGAPASAGIPLTHRGLSRSFVLVTGHEEVSEGDSPDFAALARMETIAFYMGMKHIADNCQALIDVGLDPRTPAAVIQWGTRPQQHTIVGTVADLPDRIATEKIEPPAMILIGRVVELRQTIEWFEKRPLAGQTVVVTRPAEQSASLAGLLLAEGAEVLGVPTIEIAGLDDYAPVDDALRDLSRYAWLIATSANGVDALFGRMETLGGDSRRLGGVRIGAIGAATAARFRAHGIRPDLLPEEAVGESMAASLVKTGIAGKRVLLLRADIARGDLPRLLTEAGAVCDDLTAYRTVCPAVLPPSFLERLDHGEIDWITLTSPSTFNNLRSLLGSERAAALHSVRLASIGPVTTEAIRAAGFEVAAEAEEHDAAGLVAAIATAATHSESAPP